MQQYVPPFSITNRMLTYVAQIAEKTGMISNYHSFETKPHLRRNNRIRSIHSSLAIEANSLSLDEVKSVISGRTVIGPQKEIQEVKNAYQAYEQLGRFNPYSLDDLKAMHGVMTCLTVQESGVFRSHNEGVFNGDRCIFMAPPPQLVPDLMQQLFDWMKSARQEVHPLILSSVFHYEFVFIHPFADGNGRIGRLWHTLLLTQWKPMFAWLPMESTIHDRQEEYYDAINRSNFEGESTAFIAFMLSAIKAALMEAVQTSGAAAGMTTEELRWYQIACHLKKNGTITNADVRLMFQVSAATANRILAKLTEGGKLRKIRIGKSWGYQFVK